MILTQKQRQALVRDALAEMAALPVRDTPALRGVRKSLSAKLRTAAPEDVKAVALALVKTGRRWIGYEVVSQHRATLQSLTIKEIEAFGKGMASWDEVDSFGVLLSGAAWLEKCIGDADVRRWAKSKDLWWRRAALVSTVVLNARSRGGKGDTKRTLMIAEMLIADREDMVVKAMSWALRSLVPWDARAVTAFVRQHEQELAARVKREVRSKLTNGLKTPKSRPERS